MSNYKSSLRMLFGGSAVWFIFLYIGVESEAGFALFISAVGFIVALIGSLLLIVPFCKELKSEMKKDNELKQQQEAEKAENERKEQLSKENGTWVIPIEPLKEAADRLGIKDISSEANFQRMKLVIEKVLHDNKIPNIHLDKYTSRSAIESYFSKVQKLQQAEQMAQKQAEIQRLLSEERQYKNCTTQYASYRGREKSLQFCRDQITHYADVIDKCKKNADAVRSGGSRMYDISKGRESSWAIHGGIASGIAGGAAGLAVASNIQRENEQIKQQNANLSRAIGAVMATQLTQIYKEQREAEEDLEYWKEEQEKVENLLIEDLDEHELLDLLQPVVVRTIITDTGSVKMDVRLHKSPYLSIYGNVPAVVDGSIRVLLTVDGKTVGTSICTVKYGGVTSTYDEGCICMNIAEQADRYDYAFEPNHLWAVERK